MRGSSGPRAAGARAVVDSDGPSLAAALDERPWLVKVNAAEAETRHGAARTENRAAAAAAELRDRGASIAIVTRGVHGASLATADGAWSLGGCPRPTGDPGRLAAATRSWPGSSPGSPAAWRRPMPSRSPARPAPPTRGSPARAS
jgi:hypothetical protein